MLSGDFNAPYIDWPTPTLDLFFTNFPTQAQNITVLPGLSDHDAVMITSKTKSPTYKQSQQKVPLYNRANWQAIIMDMQQLEYDISNLITIPNININQLWERFHNSVQNLLLKHILHKTTRKCCSLPWISPHLRRQIKKRKDYTDKPNN